MVYPIPEKSNTFGGIPCFPFLPKRPKLLVAFLSLTSARLPFEAGGDLFYPGPLVIWCFANDTTLTYFSFRRRF